MGSRDFKSNWQRIPDEFAQKLREGAEAVRNYEIEIKRRDRATRILKLVGTTNLLFDSKKQARLFREDNLNLPVELYTHCETEHDLAAKLASLVALFEVSLDPLRALVQDPGDRRSIKLIEKWLQDNGITYNPDAIRTWESIVTLRNAAPIHANTRAMELTDALRFFGCTLPIDNSKLWNAILDKFVWSLEEWQRILQQLPVR